jgi:hypothetical protein
VARAAELREAAFNEKVVQARAQNDMEMEALHIQKLEQSKEFQESWDNHEVKLRESAIADMEALNEVHNRQLQEAHEQIEATLTNVFKPSKALLDARNVFDKFIKQKKYTEAHNIRVEIEKMEQKEQTKHF